MNVLTPEQLAQIAFQKEMDGIRQANEIEQKLLVARLDAVRMAKEALTENRRNLPVSERNITADEITEYADTLVNYIKG